MRIVTLQFILVFNIWMWPFIRLFIFKKKYLSDILFLFFDHCLSLLKQSNNRPNTIPGRLTYLVEWVEWVECH